MFVEVCISLWMVRYISVIAQNIMQHKIQFMLEKGRSPFSIQSNRIQWLEMKEAIGIANERT